MAPPLAAVPGVAARPLQRLSRRWHRGFVLRPMLGGPLLFSAPRGGVLFERARTPALELPVPLCQQPGAFARKRGGRRSHRRQQLRRQRTGVIALEMDGQMVQLLGTLQSDDRAMAFVRAGTRLRIEDVDAARNRCTVSLLSGSNSLFHHRTIKCHRGCSQAARLSSALWRLCSSPFPSSSPSSCAMSKPVRFAW